MFSNNLRVGMAKPFHQLVFLFHFIQVVLLDVLQLLNMLFQLHVVLLVWSLFLRVHLNLVCLECKDFLSVLHHSGDAILLEEHFNFRRHLLVDFKHFALSLANWTEISQVHDARLAEYMRTWRNIELFLQLCTSIKAQVAKYVRHIDLWQWNLLA